MNRNCLGQYTFKNDTNKVTHKSCPNSSQPKSDIKNKNNTSSTQQSSSQSVNHNNQIQKKYLYCKKFN